jgi:hypothetical protein
MRRPALALLALVVTSTSSFAQGSFDPAVAAGLRYRYIGPVGNRVSSVVGIPGDPNTYYAGAASGGIWKTTDGGINWQPIFDNQQGSSIGALAVAKSNPNIELSVNGGEVDGRIGNDSVDLALGPGNVTIQARRHSISDLSQARVPF